MDITGLFSCRVKGALVTCSKDPNCIAGDCIAVDGGYLVG